MITDEAWLGLLLRSESDQPHEWLPLAWVVRNRVESNRYPHDYAGVILQPWQFSYFNQWIGGEEAEVYQLAQEGYAGEDSGWPDNNLWQAEECAAEFLHLPRYHAPFAPDVYHFWAPGPLGGRDPSWARHLRVFTLPGLPRWKFGAST